MGDRDVDVAMLLDEREIEQLMVRYIDRVDANDPVGAAACFAPDGIGIYWGEYRGRDAIATRLAEILDAFLATSHHLSNVAVEVDGDTARAMSYVYAFHTRTGDHSHLHVWGRWIDRLVRTDEGWHFAHRAVVLIGRLGDHPTAIDEDDRLVGHPGRLQR
jgi:uncharacterized protein (TIGR02246 family)